MDQIVPPGAIPADEFNVTPPAMRMPPASNPGLPPGAVPEDQFQSEDEAYGTPGQQVKSFLEGAAQGVAGPLATIAEKNILKVKPEDILGRERVNPIPHGVGEAVGLTGGALTGVGEAAVMTKAGEAATALAGLGKLTEGASLGYKVGSSAVQQAAEMAVMSAGDETSKMILHDPNTSAQSAIANVGLSAALGGAGGAFITGAINPLWHATAGPKVEELLGAVKNHLNGESKLIMPEAIETATKELGITNDPILRAAMSQNPKAVNIFNELKEVQRPEVMKAIENLHKQTSDKVMESLGINADDIMVHSENEAGHDLLDAFKKEYNEKYEPIADALDKRNAEAAHIPVSDDNRLDQYGKLVEKGMATHSVNSPYYKLYDEYGQRLLDAENIGAMDKIKTEINNRLRGMNGPGTDFNIKEALSDIKKEIANFQENHIAKSIEDIGKPLPSKSNIREMHNRMTQEAGQAEYQKLSKSLLAERQAANKNYAEFANMSDDLTNHLGIGDFRGAGGLKYKLTEKVSPEQLLNKFSIRGNSDFIPFLQKNFPETFDKVKQNELKRLLKPAVLGAKGENPINVSKIADLIEKGMAGKKEYIQSILPPGALQKIQAAKTLTDAIPNPKSSGTAGWLMKLTKHVPANVMAATSFVMGHNPISGLLAGEMAQRLSKNAPEAIKLAYLKFLSSDKPINAAAFKATVDFIDATYKGNNLLSKGTKAIFKSGAQVLGESQRPSQIDRDKLDKAVTKITDNPQSLINAQQGHVGHYFPDHQTALTQTSAQAVQYLQSVKPKPYKPSPMDAEIKPLPAQEARYNRALDIAQQPAILLEHIKKGTLQSSDIADLHAMYPSIYSELTQKISNELMNRTAADEVIPYKTRMSASLFLGYPIDSTMTPSSIAAAQPLPKPIPQAQGGAQGKTRKGTTTLGKSNKTYETQTQSAEADRHDRT